MPTSHEIWTFVGRPLADAPSACKQAAYDGKSKNQTALVLQLYPLRHPARPYPGPAPSDRHLRPLFYVEILGLTIQSSRGH